MAPSGNSEAVKVVVRCRPLNSKEKQDGRLKIVEVSEEDAAQRHVDASMLKLALTLALHNDTDG
jgi:hypothetical protein